MARNIVKTLLNIGLNPIIKYTQYNCSLLLMPYKHLVRNLESLRYPIIADTTHKIFAHKISSTKSVWLPHEEFYESSVDINVLDFGIYQTLTMYHSYINNDIMLKLYAPNNRYCLYEKTYISESNEFHLSEETTVILLPLTKHTPVFQSQEI